MKRTICLLASLALLLALLPACRNQAEPNGPPQPEILLPALDIARAISAAAADEPEGGPESLGDQLELYAEAAYGLTGEQWEDCAVLRAAGARAYEIAVLRFADEAGTAYGEEALGAYRNTRRGAFTGYAPAEADLVSKAVICRQGWYVGLFICEEPEAAKELFLSILDSGEIPELVPKPELDPEPVSESEPDTEAPVEIDLNQIVDMDSLAEALRNYCKDEIAEITAAGGFVATGTPRSMRETFGDMAEWSYGIPAGQWEDGFTFNAMTNVSNFQLTVFRMVDQDAAIAGMDGLRNYRDGVQALYTELQDGVVTISEENVEPYMYVSGAHIIQDGEYLALFICRDAADVSEFFQKALVTLRSADPATPTVQPAEDPQGVEIAEGVYVAEVTWAEPEGEPDPDHLGRLRYVPTGSELMEIYDTSAIVSAWKRNDPSGLSDYDRAIYDAAKAALEEVIRDGMSDFEKEVAIYDWVLQNVEYGWGHMDVLEEEARDAYTPYGGLVEGEAVCLGYATTFQLLTELAGLESLTVVGVGHSTEDHGWNMVRLNGQWYCVDATWDWSFHLSDMIAGREINDREWHFFNTTSDYMARTNHQWDYDAVPEATAKDYGAG